MQYKISKSDWNRIGIKAGWKKEAQAPEGFATNYIGEDSGRERPTWEEERAMKLEDAVQGDMSVSKAMKILVKNSNIDGANNSALQHKLADELLCKKLIELGQSELVEDYKQLTRRFG